MRHARALAVVGLALVATSAAAGPPPRFRAGLRAHLRGSLAQLVVMHTYGQSNARGNSGGGLPVSTTNGAPSAAPYGNYEYRTSTWVRAYSNTGSADTEQLCYGALNTIASRHVAGGASLLLGACQEAGVNSQSYAQLADGTANWTTMWTEAAAMRSGYAAQFPTAPSAPTPLVAWLQGETDQVLGTSRATYVADLLDLWQDVCDEVSGAPWSLTACPPLYLVPYGGVTRLGGPGTSTLNDSSEIVMAHYEACRDWPTRFVCAHSGYASAMTASNEHYSGAGHRLNGAQVGWAWERLNVVGAAWRPLMPVDGQISCVSNVVHVPLSGGQGSTLVIDTTNIPAHPHLGFDYTDAQVDPPTIVSATVSSSLGEVQLTLSRPCDPLHPGTVSYAAWGGPACSSGRTGSCGTGGNVRRSNCVASYWGGEYLCDWLVPFEEVVDTVTATPGGVPVFADLGFGVRVSNASSWAHARSSSVTDAATAMSVFLWARMPASFAANQVLQERWGAVGARNWSLRTNTSGRFEVYISGTGGTALSRVCTTPASVLTASTWMHVGFTFDGAGDVIPYVNGVASSCSTGSSGAAPATMSNGFWSPMTIGGSSGGGNNLDAVISHVAIWRMALAPTRVAALFASSPLGRPTDPRLQSAAHYWPLQGDLDDLGYAAARPAHLFGSGAAIVETGSLFGTSDSLVSFGASTALSGATAATVVVDLTANTPSQAGTVVEANNSSDTARQLAVEFTSARQLTARLAAATSGTGQWPVDAGRAECTTSGTAMTAGARYRALVRYASSGLRVWWAPLTSSTDSEGRAVTTVGTAVEQTVTCVGTLPAALTSPAGGPAWTIGRRASATTSTGLRSAALNGNTVAVWASAVAVADVQSVLEAQNLSRTALGEPALQFRARGAQVVETQALGVGTATGLALVVQYVTPVRRASVDLGEPEAWANAGAVRRTSGGTSMTLAVSSGSAIDGAAAAGHTPSSLELNVANLRGGVGQAAMDTLVFWNRALTDAEMLSAYCATQPSPRAAACSGVTANASTALRSHPCLVDMWRFDDAANLGASETGLHDLGNTTSAEAAPAIP